MFQMISLTHSFSCQNSRLPPSICGSACACDASSQVNPDAKLAQGLSLKGRRNNCGHKVVQPNLEAWFTADVNRRGVRLGTPHRENSHKPVRRCTNSRLAPSSVSPLSCVASSGSRWFQTSSPALAFKRQNSFEPGSKALASSSRAGTPVTLTRVRASCSLLKSSNFSMRSTTSDMMARRVRSAERPDVGAGYWQTLRVKHHGATTVKFQSKKPHDCWTTTEVCCANPSRSRRLGIFPFALAFWAFFTSASTGCLRATAILCPRIWLKIRPWVRSFAYSGC